MSDVEEIAHAIAGAGGGALSMIVTYPLVTISTLAQTAKKDKKPVQVKLGSISLTTHQKIIKGFKESTTIKVIEDVIRTKGILGFYSGLESALYGITLTNFIYYYFYEWATNFFLKANLARGRKGKGLSAIQNIIAGAIAGAITCVGSNPLWVVNTRMMTSKNSGTDSPPGALRTLVNIIQQDGVPALFSGVLPALVLVINPIIQYTIFDQVKNLIILRNGPKAFTGGHAFLLGALGKLIATTLTYPYITLKARMHVSKSKSEVSMIQQIKNIINREGVEGLYSGLSIKLLQSISTAAFLFYFKEELLTGSVRLVEMVRLLKKRK